MRPSSVPLSSSTTHHEDTDADLGFFPLHTNEGSSPLLPPPTSWTTKKNSNEPSPFLPPSSIPKNKHPSLSTQASSTHPLNLASMETPPTRFTTTTLPPSNFRWVILSLTCTVLVGNYFAYDQVAALNIPLETYLGLPNTTYQYLIGSFYIAYSLPNIVLPFLGGSFMDRYGAQWIAFVFSIFVVLGQYCFTFGIIGKSQGWAIFGRCLFGIGSETLAVAQQRITTKWFIGNELALAVGINLSVARLGSVINDVVSPILAHRYSIPISLWFGFSTCALSFLSTLLLLYLDRRYHTYSAEAQQRIPLLLNTTLSPWGPSPSPTMHLKKDDRLSSTSWTAWWKPFRRTLRSFPKIFWLMQVSLVLLYGTIVPFNTIHSAFLKSKWYPDQPELAAQVMGIPDTISALLVPVVGYFFDRFGQRGYALLLCAVLIALSHLMLGILPNTLLSSPILPLIFLGTAYALILTFIPTIPLVVQENALGAAYGLSNSFSNLSWAIFPILVASLITHDSTYFSTELFFSFCALLAIGVSIHILQLDKRIHHQVLQRPSNSLTNPRPRHETSSEIGLVPLRSHSPSGITGPATRLNKSKEKSEVD